MSLRTLLGPAPAAAHRIAEAPPGCSRCDSFFLYPSGVDRPRADRPRARGRSSRSTPPSRSPRARPGCAARSSALARRGRAPRSTGGAGIARHRGDGTPGRSGRRCRRCSPCGAVHQPLSRRRPARRARPGGGGRRRVRRARLRRPARLRRRRHLPPPRPGDRGRRGRRAPTTATSTSPEAQDRFQAAVEAGVLKIMSKMGICTVDSYRGAQIFEVVGLGRRGRRRLLHRHAQRGRRHRLGRPGRGRARPPRGRLAATRLDLASPGFYPGAQGRRVPRQGQGHGPGPQRPDAGAGAAGRRADRDMLAAHLLQAAIRAESSERYDAFAKLVNDRPPIELHDLLELVPAARAGAARRGRARRRHRPPVLDRRHVARLARRRRPTRRWPRP